MDISSYLLLRALHLGAVGTSLTLFAARGLGVAWGAHWPMHAAARRLSVLIDCLLLGGGVGLWWWVGHNPLHEPWLAAKLALLPVYVVLGSYALKRGRSPRVRTLCLLLALGVAATLMAMARTRSALPGLA